MRQRSTRALRRLAAACVVTGAAAALAAGVISAQAAPSPIVEGLTAPRGLTVLDNGDLLIAEGGAGRLLRLPADAIESAAGDEQVLVEIVVDGLPATLEGGPTGADPTGISAAVWADGTYFFVTGEFDAEGFQSLYAFQPGGEPELIANLHDFEIANNPDGEVDADGNAENLSNPYDIAVDPQGGLFISDSGANAILRVDASGAVSVYAAFPNRENPLFPDLGGPTMDTVPTGITVAPDGALYVATLTGFPFPNSGAVIYRLADLNSDGDALDDGETLPVIEGLTTATDLAFLPDGSILVTEFSTNILEMAPGRLVRVTQRGQVTQIQEAAGGLIAPTSVAVTADSRVFVSQEFAGVVSAVTLPPPPTLPTSGSGGLADSAHGKTTWILLAAAAGGMALAGAVALRRLA